MFLTVTDIAIVALGFVALAVWILFYVKGLKYAEMFEPLDSKEFPMKDLYFVGYAVLETIKYKYVSKTDRRLRQEAEILYGEKYTEYYLRVIHSQQVTLAMTLVVFSFVFSKFSIFHEVSLAHCLNPQPSMKSFKSSS